MKRLDWFLARRYLSSRRGGPLLSFITWIALGGVIVGVTALVVVIAVMTGMQEDLREKILASHPHILVMQNGSDVRLDDWQRVVDTVMAVDGVTAAAPFVLVNVTFQRVGSPYNQTGALYGVRAEDAESAPTDLERDIAEGAYDLGETESGLPPALVGSRLAGRMGLIEGDTLQLFAFENLQMTAIGGVAPAVGLFEMTGVFETGMFDADSKNLYTTLEAAQDLRGFDARTAGGLGVRTANADDANRVSEEIGDRLGLGYYPQPWSVANQALFSALELEKLAMYLILFLIVLVAAFNIVSTLIMVVHDRTREIGILKSMGMTDDGILKVFMIQGAWIGIIGTFFGTLLGVFLCWLIDTFEIIKIPPEIYFVDKLPVQLNPIDVLWIVSGSVAIALLATIYPSFQAARLQPVEAIRSE